MTDKLEKKVDQILEYSIRHDEHLKTLNSKVAKHEKKFAEQDEKFSNIIEEFKRTCEIIDTRIDNLNIKQAECEGERKILKYLIPIIISLISATFGVAATLSAAGLL